MPKQNKFQIDMPTMYKADLFEKLLIGWVIGQRSALQGVSERESVKNFLNHFNLNEDDINYETVLQKYWRLKSVLYEAIEKK